MGRVPDPVRDDVEPTCFRHPGRSTMVRCSGCERPICTDCMHATPVGVRCPECAGVATGVRGAVQRRARRSVAPVTAVLIGINLAAFVLQLATGGVGLSGSLTNDGVLWGPAVDGGEWWRIFTSGFLHLGLGHIALNMLSLWIVGSIVESVAGGPRYLAIYISAIIWGGAGAMFLQPGSAAAGASGGIFGVFAALLVLQLHNRGTLSSDLLGIFALNLVLTFALPGISIGGHLGGIVGGALATLAVLGAGRRGRRVARGPALASAALVAAVGFALAIAAADRSLSQIAALGGVL